MLDARQEANALVPHVEGQAVVHPQPLEVKVGLHQRVAPLASLGRPHKLVAKGQRRFFSVRLASTNRWCLGYFLVCSRTHRTISKLFRKMGEAAPFRALSACPDISLMSLSQLWSEAEFEPS